MRRIVLLTICLIAPLAVLAIPTGLNSMPTAEVLAPGETRVEYEFNGNGRLYAPTTSTVTGSQTGMAFGMEGGIDKVSDGDTVYNLKLAIVGEGLLKPAIAVGAQNIGSDTKTQWYAVATKTLAPASLLKISAGVLRDGELGTTLTMVGAGAKLGPVTVKVDRVMGGNERTAYGATVNLSGVTITGTQYDFDDSGVEDEQVVTLGFTTRTF